MAESPRRSNRLQSKNKRRRSQNNALMVKFSPKNKSQDEDMCVLQSKQSRVPRHSDNLELGHIIGSRANNFTRVHNSYCTFDRMKYDGYVHDPSFINDGSSTSASSEEDTDSDEVPDKSKRAVIHSSSDSEVGQGDETEVCGTNGIEQIFLETPIRESGYGDRNVLKRENPRVGPGCSSDEELISSARKPKISIISSSTESGSEENTLTSPSILSRAPSLRALKVQARMNEDRKKKFANFRAKRVRSKQSVDERAKSDSSVINLREVRRELREEAELLPSEHQSLSGLRTNRNLFGDSTESSSAGEESSEFNASYLQALSYTRQLSGEEEFKLELTNDSDGIFNDTSPPLPIIYEFSDTTAAKEEFQFSIKQQMLCSHCTIASVSSSSPPFLETSNSPPNTATEAENYSYPPLIDYNINLEEFVKFSPVEPNCVDFKEIPSSDKLGVQKTHRF